MTWASLNLWEEEEKRIHDCLLHALRQLILSKLITTNDGELEISRKLHPYLYQAKKFLRLIATIKPETSVFEENNPKPIGHPDICFCFNLPNYLPDAQYDYDVECKLVRVQRKDKSRDYCKHYSTDGIKRFQEGKYAQASPPMGAMIGYVQEGEFAHLLDAINKTNTNNGLEQIILLGQFCEQDVTQLRQQIYRATENFFITHFWADFREKKDDYP